MSYASIEDAEVYVLDYYPSTSTLRQAWDQLSDEDKIVLLNRAEQAIDHLPLTGRPCNPPKAFPRTPLKEESLEAVKTATIELAVQGLDDDAKGRYDLRKQGVKSYRIGDLSETFEGGMVSGSGADGLTLSIVYPYLRPWLGGGYRLCPQHTPIRR